MAEFSIAVDGIWVSIGSPAGEFRCCFPDVPRTERRAFAKRLRDHDKERVRLKKWDTLTGVSTDPEEVKHAEKQYSDLVDTVEQMDNELDECFVAPFASTDGRNRWQILANPRLGPDRVRWFS